MNNDLKDTVHNQILVVTGLFFPGTENEMGFLFQKKASVGLIRQKL